MTTIKKHVELLETEIEELKKTVGHQKELMTMMKDSMLNQKMILEMIVSKLNERPNPSPASETSAVTPTEALKPAAPDTPVVFPMNRRVMV
jgi:hypothetical protein